MNRILQAANFAATKHSRQRRKNTEATPYINHPIEVAELLATEGNVSDEDVLVAALLHDTIEDTDTTFEEIQRQFGQRVADIVSECTDDKSLDKVERKRLQIENAPHKTKEAALVKIADKTCNLRSILDDPPQGWSVTRQREYFEWAEQVVEGLVEANKQLKEQFQLVLCEGRQILDSRCKENPVDR